MAERPVFVSATESGKLVCEIFFEIKWHPGFAVSQKEKNIQELHAAAEKRGFRHLLEISSKSKNERGQHLSAFHMKVKMPDGREIPMECAFQGSKVFERGGPFTDLYWMEPRDAKRDPRLKESGSLTGFKFADFCWPLEPKTAFYDWLYVTFLKDWREWAEKLYSYGGFTDIEFNPHRSINCQARSCALFLTLMKRNLLDDAIKSPQDFITTLLSFDYRPQLRAEHGWGTPTLFSGTLKVEQPR
jgi:Family of unknown function (DUF6977)